MIIRDNFCKLCIETHSCCDPSSEPSCLNETVQMRGHKIRFQ